MKKFLMVHGQKIPVQAPTPEDYAIVLAPFPEMVHRDPDHREAPCSTCGEILLTLPKTTPSGPLYCVFCGLHVLTEDLVPPPGVELEFAQMRIMRRENPKLLSAVIVILLNKLGLARVTPEAAARAEQFQQEEQHG